MIVTHQNLDWDSIAGCWLLQRFGGFGSEEVRFVNTGNPDPALLAQASAVVDTGKIFNVMEKRFDHHQLPGQEANDTCATAMIYTYLPNMPQHLKPLIDLIFAGDTGRPKANHSRELGLHALLSAYKQMYKEKHGAFAPDDIILSWGYQQLDLLDLRLRKQAEAKAELAEKVVYKSDDNLVWAIKHGSIGSSFAAFEEGARLVVFEGEPIEDAEGSILSYPVGIQRATEWTSPNAVELVRWGIEYTKNRWIKDELESWFCHAAGFFAGRGTGKAPDPRPIQVNLEDIARLIDQVWDR